MKVEYLNNRFSRYATTNPPISETKEFKFYYPEGAPVFEVYSYYNGAESKKQYKVGSEQESELLKLLEEINISRLIDKKLNEKKEPDITAQMCGGMSSSIFRAKVDGKEAGFENLTDDIISVISKMNTLLEGCGEPFFTEESGQPAVPAGIGAAPVQPVQPPVNNEAPAEGEWKCPACGFAHNKGNFCCECGTPKE